MSLKSRSQYQTYETTNEWTTFNFKTMHCIQLTSGEECTDVFGVMSIVRRFDSPKVYSPPPKPCMVHLPKTVTYSANHRCFRTIEPSDYRAFVENRTNQYFRIVSLTSKLLQYRPLLLKVYSIILFYSICKMSNSHRLKMYRSCRSRNCIAQYTWSITLIVLI